MIESLIAGLIVFTTAVFVYLKIRKDVENSKGSTCGDCTECAGSKEQSQDCDNGFDKQDLI